jgi:hypothetical protein
MDAIGVIVMGFLFTVIGFVAVGAYTVYKLIAAP